MKRLFLLFLFPFIVFSENFTDISDRYDNIYIKNLSVIDNYKVAIFDAGSGLPFLRIFFDNNEKIMGIHIQGYTRKKTNDMSKMVYFRPNDFCFEIKKDKINKLNSFIGTHSFFVIYEADNKFLIGGYAHVPRYNKRKIKSIIDVMYNNATCCGKFFTYDSNLMKEENKQKISDIVLRNNGEYKIILEVNGEECHFASLIMDKKLNLKKIIIYPIFFPNYPYRNRGIETQINALRHNPLELTIENGKIMEEKGLQSIKEKEY